MPINSSGDFAGSFWDLFNLYTLLGGVAVVLLFAFHGATYLTLRTTGELCRRAAAAAGRLSIATAVVGAGFLIWTVAVAVDRNDKDVFPPLLPALLAIAALLGAVVCVRLARSGWAFVLTAAGAFLVVATIFTSLYPRVMVASNDFANSLTVDNASSAHYTLKVMTVVALIVDAGHPALPGLDVLRLPAAPRPRGRGLGGEPRADRSVPGRRRRGAEGTCGRSIRGCSAARALRGRCSSSTARSGSLRRLLVIAQATLLARVVARGFDGASLADAEADRAALVAVFGARGALAWGFELAGRRAATRSVATAARARRAAGSATSPAALDGAESAELAAAAVQGLDALETYFARFLPQLVLAVVVPVAVLVARCRDRSALCAA